MTKPTPRIVWGKVNRDGYQIGVVYEYDHQTNSVRVRYYYRRAPSHILLTTQRKS